MEHRKPVRTRAQWLWPPPPSAPSTGATALSTSNNAFVARKKKEKTVITKTPETRREVF